MAEREWEEGHLAEQLRQACAELVHSLQSGRDSRSEDLLSRYPALAQRVECALEVIYTEFTTRAQLGQPSAPDSWYERFPQWRERLQRLFEAHRFLEGDSTVEQSQAITWSARVGAGADPAHPEPPAWIDRYEVLEKLGGGAMGIIYKVHDTELGRIVALKTLRRGPSDRTDNERFQREPLSIARLDHPHIVPLYEIGQHDGCPYFTMKLARGGCLTQHKERLLRDPRAAVALMEKVARAVHYAHQDKILHRDLKPGNILLDEKGEPLVSDFGLAKWLEASIDLTRSGQMLGTIPYMAPEQAAGRTRELSAASEVWSLGVILYELLTGRRPFVAADGEDLCEQIQTADALPPQTLRAELDDTLGAVVLKCLEKDPTCRYASAEVLADDLHRWLLGERKLPARKSWAWRLWRKTRRSLAQRRTGWMAACLTVLFLVPISAWLILAALDRAKQPNLVLSPDEWMLLQQQEVLDDLRRTLDASDQASLIGPSGQLRYSRVRTEETALKLHPAIPATNRTPAVEAGLNIGLLELLPEVPCGAYRFRAEMLHDQCPEDGHVGIYCAYRGEATDTGRHHYFIGLNFNERGLKGIHARNKQGQDCFQVNFNLWHYREQGPGPGQSSNAGIQQCLEPRCQEKEMRWRRLEIAVTPQWVEAVWEGKPMGQGHWTWDELLSCLTMEQILGKAQKQRLQLPPAAPGTTGDKPLASLVSRQGGLGLFVSGGQAYVRNVTVEPFDNH
jgi:hypothetical protein